MYWYNVSYLQVVRQRADGGEKQREPEGQLIRRNRRAVCYYRTKNNFHQHYTDLHGKYLLVLSSTTKGETQYASAQVLPLHDVFQILGSTQRHQPLIQ